MHEVPRDGVCFVLYVWFCRAMHIETSKILRDDPSYRCSEQNWAFLCWTPFFWVASARKGGIFVLNTHKNHRLRTKLGVFCAEELEKVACQNKIGGVLCWRTKRVRCCDSFFVKSWEKICKLRKKVYLCNPIRKRLVWGTDLDHGLIR